jgi:TonB family protein
MKILLFVIGCVLLLAPSRLSAQSSPWKTYTVKGEEFSIALPVVPAMTSYERSLRGSSSLERVIGSYEDGVVYTMLQFENKNQQLSSFIERQTALATFQLAGAGREIVVGNVSGKEFDVAHSPASGVVQFFSTPGHLYQFMVVGAGLGDPRVTKFFSSIRFQKAVKAIEVVDGAGPIDSKKIKSQSLNLDRAFVARDVSKKAIVVSKPDPTYTIDARRNALAGKVVIRAVLAANGDVVDIRVLQGLPLGLSDSAMDAAKQIRFIPALKDGQYVSMTIELEYEFNLK